MDDARTIDEILSNVDAQNVDAGNFDHEAFGGAATIHLHATDDPPGHPGEWMISVDAGTVTWDHSHGKGDVAVRAPTSELLLVLRDQRSVADLEVFGDPDIVARWQAATRP